jgi:elongator complex protein 1
MKNLFLLKKSNFSCKEKNIVGFTDEIKDSKHYFVTKEGMLQGLHISTGEIFFTFDLSSHLEKDSCILSLKYISEKEELCIISNKGEILTYSLVNHEVEIVGVFTEGLRCMSWSPNEEMVLFVTGNKTCLAMTKEFDVIYENLILKDEQDWNNHHTIVSISWRKDGKNYVINVQEDQQERSLYIYERNGTLVAKNEKKKDLYSLVDYVPDGSLVTSIQFKKEKKETCVVFFETNGLSHYDFLLEKGDSPSVIHSLQWNANSELLAIAFSSCVQLWFRSNYHWYMKQEISLKEDEKVVLMKWDSEKPYSLFLFTSMSFLSFHFQWEVSYDKQVQKKDNPCLVSVVDGNKVCMTPLSHALIPPPMCLTTLTTKQSIQSIHFVDQFVFVQHSHRKVDIYEMNVQFQCTLIQSFEALEVEEIHGFTPISKDEYFYLSEKEELFNTNKKIHSFKMEKIMKVIPIGKGILLQNEHGHVYQWNKEEIQDLFSFPYPCYEMGVLMTMDNKISVLGLSERGVLYLNSKVLVSNCTSFSIHHEYFLFTTFSHQLRIIK